MTSQVSALTVRLLGVCSYMHVWQEMQHFTDIRDDQVSDELWLVQHPPVFTQGQAGKAEHILNPGDIPVVKTDRGGQVTYHGPGQIIAYPLLNLRRLGVGVRDLVNHLENSVIELLGDFGIQGSSKKEAPGVYVGGAKIASLGLRVRKGCTFHGVSLNAKMDLEPFLRVNPCGYSDLQMTQMVDHVPEGDIDLESLQKQFAQVIAKSIGYDHCKFINI